MSVYVDDMRAPFGKMIMCHMVADSHDELVAMATRLGVSRRWLQNEGTYREHFDLSLTKRSVAVRLGAIEVTQRRVGEIIRARRVTSEMPAASTPVVQNDPYAEDYHTALWSSDTDARNNRSDTAKVIRTVVRASVEPE
jgi:hypothetical protein